MPGSAGAGSGMLWQGLQCKALDIEPGSALGWRSRSQGLKSLEIHSFASSSES